MKINEIIDPHNTYDPNTETNRPHAQAHAETGFWGRAGAGCLIMARSTGRFLVAHRSREVLEPGTWGTWGGAIDQGLDPVEAVKREVHQECGYTGPVTMEPMFVFKSGTFRYFNFLAIVDEEFKPTLDWENQGSRWCRFGAWPTPMHPGLKALLADPASVTLMQAEAQKASPSA